MGFVDGNDYYGGRVEVSRHQFIREFPSERVSGKCGTSAVQYVDLQEKQNYQNFKSMFTNYTKDNPLKVVTLCSGYDSQCMALDRIRELNPDFDYELVAWSEIDKYAIIAHNAVYPQWKERNLGDMTKIDWEKFSSNIDLLFYSTPCTDFSNAGKQAGGEEGSGTRSSILWYTRNAIKAKRPRICIMENVKALVSAKFKPLFQRWEQELASYGYYNYCKVLNAKDYGIPQNRERIFLVSIRDEQSFSFGEPFQLELRLKDMLEEKVDEKYYLDDEKVAKFVEHCDRKQAEGCGFKFEPSNGGGMPRQ